MQIRRYFNQIYDNEMYTDVDIRIQIFLMWKQKRYENCPSQVTDFKVGSRTLFQRYTDCKGRCKQINDLIYD